MMFIKYDETGFVNYIHAMPFDAKYGLGKTETQLRQEGILVDTIPTATQIVGKVATLYYNTAIHDFYFKYTDIPKTQEDIIKELQVETANINYVLMMGGLI